MNEGIAIIGMSGRFPGARNTSEYWENLRQGTESISRFSLEEMGLSEGNESSPEQKNRINAGGVLDDVDLFDAHFFGLNARDAEIMDPQHRLFLECSWESLEDAGYNPKIFPGAIGVYAGTSMSTYVFNIYAQADRMPNLDYMQVLLLNDKDHLTTHVSYKLNLRGPSMAVQTACSTSLVAICTACDALWAGRCDMALAGGAAISLPQRKGYTYQPGGIMSPDGHCRPFDASAKGTVGGNGVGVVVLKPASRAIADGDHIYAIIKGAAINNDGNLKVGYTAPSVEGQARVIAKAHAMAEVDPATISYVEAHGTATQLGDPIEVAALTQAFRQSTDKTGFCAIGSAKSNIGHLDSAAGVAGLIKTALALKHRVIPASLHYRQPNPEIDFASSPFYVNTQAAEWRANGTPRRAGVSSFGIGGTNAHCILEEYSASELSGPSRSAQLLLLSAPSEKALPVQTSRLASYLHAHPSVNLADVAYILQVGREAFSHRTAILLPSGCTPVEAAGLLEREAVEQRLSNRGEASEKPIVFLFSGQGTQYINMGRELYEREPGFRTHFDLCCELLRPHTDVDLRELLFPSEADRERATALLTRTAVAQPALFAIEYALAKLWIQWGIVPEAMMGHSIGEYVAACLSGVLQLSDALELVASRGVLMDCMSAGAMLSVPLSEAETRSLVTNRKLSLASVNGPTACVISGPIEDIEQVERQLATRGLFCRRLVTSHAFHSSMMEAVVAPFIQQVRRVHLSAPKIPYISNVTGTWITPEEATDPLYWGSHLRQCVRFADGARTLLEQIDGIFLEIGPGRTLGSLLKMQPAAADRLILATLRPAQDAHSDTSFLLAALADLWRSGATVDWTAFSSTERRRRLALPTYPFEGQRYWIGPPDKPETSVSRRPVDDWFYVPVWSASPSAIDPRELPVSLKAQAWLLIGDASALAEALTTQLEFQGARVTRVAAEGFAEVSLHPFQQILYLPLYGPGSETDRAFWALLELAQLLGKQSAQQRVTLNLVASRLHAVAPTEPISPSRALCLGPRRVIPQEYPNISCRSIDVSERESPEALATLLLREITSETPITAVAFRAGARWTQSFEPIALKTTPTESTSLLRPGGVYLITGGFGGIGLTLADHLARTVQAKLVLVGRSAPDSSKLLQLEAMEQAGAEIMIAAADIAKADEMAAVIRAAQTRFGSIDGVIHSAGVAGGGIIQLKSRPVAAAVLSPKVAGTQILFELLRDQPVRFFVICSSLASVYGGFGQVDYCAANNFLDAFARAHSTPNCPVISIGWDTWRDVGMAVNTVLPEELQASREESLRRGIASDEGVEAFARILHARLPHVAVCTTDLQAGLTEPVAEESSSPPASPPVRAQAAHPRPALATAYLAPRTEIETGVADLWQDLLGVAPIGVNDNFFELGGHSLLAVQMISHLRTRFEVEMTVQNLFDLPTVAKLAEHIEASAGVFGDAETLARLLDQVEQLSESEINALLDGDRPAEGRS